MTGRVRRALRHGDVPWHTLLLILTLGTLLIVGAIAWVLWRGSSGARESLGWSFLSPTLSASWNPVIGKFQAWPFIYGTLSTAMISLLLALPISLGVAVFLAEVCPPRLRGIPGALVELLGAIPSVIYGLWGMFVFLPSVVAPLGNIMAKTLGQVPFLRAFWAGPVPVSGLSRLGAALVLTIMMLPTISSVYRDVLLAIPPSQREAAFALGSTRWEMISRVLVPYSLSGLVGAALLGLGRALGETMAVTMVIGNSLEPGLSLLRPGYTMASVIANEFAEAVTSLHSGALLEVALVLFGITLLLNSIARLLVWSVGRRGPRESRL